MVQKRSLKDMKQKFGIIILQLEILYPMLKRRNGGANPKNMEVSRGRRLLDDSNGSKTETPVQRELSTEQQMSEKVHFKYIQTSQKITNMLIR